jgi:hypothetical protein
MKSETINISERLLMEFNAPLRNDLRLVNGAFGRRGCLSMSLTRRNTCIRPPLAGMVCWILLPNIIAPTRFPCRVNNRASTVTKSISIVRFSVGVCSVPKSTDGLISSRNQAVTSRSS